MASPPDESTSRKAIVSTLVSTLLSPLSLLLGFYLGHALQKPRLSIADLDQSYYLKAHAIPADLSRELAAQPLLVNALRSELMRSALARSEDPCTPWLDGEEWEDRCTDSVLLTARGLAGALIAESDMPLPDLLKAMRLSQEQRDSLGAALKHLIAELEAIRSDPREQRTGKMDFDVGVLNTGDFDGVVAKFGKLTFSGGSFTITADHYTVVKSHGFETIKFAARDVIAPEQQAFNKWQDLVKARAETKFHLELESGEKKPIPLDATLFK